MPSSGALTRAPRPPLCSECGLGRLMRCSVQGHRMTYRGVRLVLQGPGSLRVCNRCGNDCVHFRELELYHEAIHRAYALAQRSVVPQEP